MTREEIINEMTKKANKLMKKWTRDGENEIWRMASDWNSKHEADEEIFMSEAWDDAQENLIGFYIEDDHWTFEF